MEEEARKMAIDDQFPPVGDAELDVDEHDRRQERNEEDGSFSHNCSFVHAVGALSHCGLIGKCWDC